MPAFATVPASGSNASIRPRAATLGLWVLQIALALALGAAGAAKLAGAPAMVQLFDAIGMGQWFRYVTGTIEMIGAIMLLIPRAAALGALMLAGVMVGAIAAHIFVLHTFPAPLPLLLGLSVVAFARRKELQLQLNRR